jgi:SAM-dependent methyltransferase
MTKMRQLPDPETYNRELFYSPWSRMIEEVASIVSTKAPNLGSVVDLMCGPGALISKIRRQGEERGAILLLEGVDIDTRFVSFAQSSGYLPRCVHADVFQWVPEKQYDFVTCTGGLHHLPYNKQERFFREVAAMLKPEGIALIGDPYITDYSSEYERRIGAIELNSHLITDSIKMNAPDEVIRAYIDVMHNDVFGHEYKTSVAKIRPTMEKYFRVVDQRFTWKPNPDKEFGDCLFVLGRKEK